LDKEETSVDKSGQYPWRLLDADVCAVLVRLASGKGRVNISGPGIISDYYNEHTGPEKVGYSLIRVKEGQSTILEGGASARCFRRSQ
jgi:hypothetical protein